MQKHFDIDTVLSVVSRFNITDNYNNVIDLVGFVVNKPNTNMIDFFKYYEKARNYIISLYPELDDPIYGFDSHYISDYVQDRKRRFGNSLIIGTIEENAVRLKKQVN